MSRMCLWSKKTGRSRTYVPAWYSYMLSDMCARLLSPETGINLAAKDAEDAKLFSRTYPSGGLWSDESGNCSPLDCLYARMFGKWLLETYGDGIVRSLIDAPGTGIPAIERAAGTSMKDLVKEFALMLLDKALTEKDDPPEIFGHDARYCLMPCGCTVTYIGTTNKEGECRLNFGSMTVGRNEKLYIAVRQGSRK